MPAISAGCRKHSPAHVPGRRYADTDRDGRTRPAGYLPDQSNIPTDPDADGIYEDLNANGRIDFADVTLYFEQMDWIGENEPVGLFDFNGNSRIDFADIVALFTEV